MVLAGKKAEGRREKAEGRKEGGKGGLVSETGNEMNWDGMGCRGERRRD